MSTAAFALGAGAVVTIVSTTDWSDWFNPLGAWQGIQELMIVLLPVLLSEEVHKKDYTRWHDMKVLRPWGTDMCRLKILSRSRISGGPPRVGFVYVAAAASAKFVHIICPQLL